MLDLRAFAPRVQAPARRLDRRELFLWVAIFLLASDLVEAFSAPHAPGVQWHWLKGLRFGAFDAIGGGVALWRLSKTARTAASWRDVALAVFLCAVGALRGEQSALLALTGLALWLWTTDREGRAASTVFLAIASHQLWGRLTLNLTFPELVKFDAAMVGEVLRLFERGVTWRGNVISMPNGFGIEVAEACSSFSNVSAALLAWVAFAKLERARWVRRDILVGAAAAASQVILNVGRLCLIVQSMPMFRFWHDGPGAQIYVTIASAVAVFIGVFGTRWAARET